MISQVYILADCIGGLLVYHTLTQPDIETDSIVSEMEHKVDVCATILDFEFIVNGVFFLGSPIGLVALNETLVTGKGTIIADVIYKLCVLMFYYILWYDRLLMFFALIIFHSILFGDI